MLGWRGTVLYFKRCPFLSQQSQSEGLFLHLKRVEVCVQQWSSKWGQVLPWGGCDFISVGSRYAGCSHLRIWPWAPLMSFMPAATSLLGGSLERLSFSEGLSWAEILEYYWCIVNPRLTHETWSSLGSGLNPLNAEGNKVCYIGLCNCPLLTDQAWHKHLK